MARLSSLPPDPLSPKGRAAAGVLPWHISALSWGVPRGCSICLSMRACMPFASKIQACCKSQKVQKDKPWKPSVLPSPGPHHPLSFSWSLNLDDFLESLPETSCICTHLHVYMCVFFSSLFPHLVTGQCLSRPFPSRNICTTCPFQWLKRRVTQYFMWFYGRAGPNWGLFCPAQCGRGLTWGGIPLPGHKHLFNQSPIDGHSANFQHLPFVSQATCVCMMWLAGSKGRARVAGMGPPACSARRWHRETGRLSPLLPPVPTSLEQRASDLFQPHG